MQKSACFHSGLFNPYPCHYSKAFAFSTFPYPSHIVQPFTEKPIPIIRKTKLAYQVPMTLQYGLGSVSYPVEFPTVCDDIANITTLPLTFLVKACQYLWPFHAIGPLTTVYITLTIPYIPGSSLPDTRSCGYVVAGASYKCVTTNACPDRKLLTAQ